MVLAFPFFFILSCNDIKKLHLCTYQQRILFLIVIHPIATQASLALTICVAIYNHRTGLVDWTGGLTLKLFFTLSNETHLPMELCGITLQPSL